jgi:hypothetical protein
MLRGALATLAPVIDATADAAEGALQKPSTPPILWDLARFPSCREWVSLILLRRNSAASTFVPSRRGNRKIHPVKGLRLTFAQLGAAPQRFLDLPRTAHRSPVVVGSTLDKSLYPVFARCSNIAQWPELCDDRDASSLILASLKAR